MRLACWETFLNNANQLKDGVVGSVAADELRRMERESAPPLDLGNGLSLRPYWIEEIEL